MNLHHSFLIFFCLAALQLSAQGWRQTYQFPSQLHRVYDLAQHPDGGFLIASTASLSNEFNAVLLKTNAEGDSLWLKPYPGQEGLLIASNSDNTFSFVTTGYINLIATEGEILSSVPIPNTENFNVVYTAEQNAVQTADEHLLLGGKNDLGDAMVMKLTKSGQEIWTTTLASPNEEEVQAIAEDEDGNIYLGLQSKPTGSLYAKRVVQKIDASGSILWRAEFPADENTSYSVSNISVINGNEGAIVAGIGQPQLLRLDAEGSTVWSDTLANNYFPIAVTEDPEGHFAVTGTVYSNDIYFGDVFLLNINEDGQHNWERIYPRTRVQTGSAIIPAEDTGYLISGAASLPDFQAGRVFLLKTDVLGYLYTNQLNGQAFLDLNNNCQKDDNEPSLPNTGLSLTKPGFENVAITDTEGFYEMVADTGNYTINPYFNSPYYAADCPSFAPAFSGFFDTLNLDIPATPIVECPLMQVHLNTPFLRRCFSSTYYVDYCNIGTALAGNVYVEITLDPFLELEGADVPFEELGPGHYKFEVEDLAIGQCGSFNFDILVSCDAELGQSHCTEAHIFPDGLCLPEVPGYSGAFLELEALCLDTTAYFRIQNTGDASMAAPLEYIVIEDAVLLEQETYSLPQGQETLITFPANGSTYYLNTPQEPGAPGATFISAVIEGCGSNNSGTFSTGFVNVFPQSDSDPWLDIDCRENIGSFDPNDIQVFPKGYGPEGRVEAGTTLEYLIRFQNTGTDTAFTVELINPLPPQLNISTLNPLGSSHNYELTLMEDGVLNFRFDDILLPDSTTNLQASQGFVRYRIDHQEGLIPGTNFGNRAAIYFDFNDPIYTNTALTTIDENFILVNLEEIFMPGLSLDAFPNPFTDFLNISFEGLSGNTLQFMIFSMDGRLVWQQERPFTPVATIRPGDLPTGQYALQVWIDQKLAAAGTIINH
ncbi:DUF7619 domain-containing protein [Phaeodactylibacter xiamenensis]|uniref:DUF7619 domain-containing protein n=1 Tax=Phaeodactylibacter xiamenensis TaxID=1524460 RepID=UPI0024A84DA8|nr:hypothetical protein [Phaeodactylibacter xiamenensis]